MRRIKHPPLRNKLDVADTQQVRLLKKRLGVSADDLLRTVEKVGNSIAAISKEVEVQKVSALRETIPTSAKEISVTAPTLSRQAARMRVLTRRPTSSTACHSTLIGVGFR
jgi:hypothetical protein